MSFFVTLPSNASTETYKDNAQSHYTTHLKTPLNLSNDYQVALVEIAYLQQIETTLGILSIEEDNKPKIEIIIKIQEHIGFESLLQTLNKSIVDAFYKAGRINTNALGALNFIVPLFTVSPKGLVFYLKVPKNTSITFEDKLAEIIGLKNYKKLDKDYELQLKMHDKYINTIDSFIVYVDIIEDQYYGNVLAPIIRTVTPQGNNGDYVSIIYSSPHYVSLKKFVFDTININIRDSQGNFIHFNNLLGKVIVKLHFKKKNE